MAETCATGTSTRKARRVAVKTGIERLSEDQAGAIAESPDADAAELPGRGPAGLSTPHIWLGATYAGAGGRAAWRPRPS